MCANYLTYLEALNLFDKCRYCEVFKGIAGPKLFIRSAACDIIKHLDIYSCSNSIAASFRNTTGCCFCYIYCFFNSLLNVQGFRWSLPRQNPKLKFDFLCFWIKCGRNFQNFGESFSLNNILRILWKFCLPMV